MSKAIKTALQSGIWEVSGLNRLDEQQRHGLRVVGMLHSHRRMGGFTFLILRMAGGLLQCVYDTGEDEALPQEESAVALTGDLKVEPRAKGGFELYVHSIEVLTQPKEKSPISLGHKINISLENGLGLRPLLLRSPGLRSVFKLQEGFVRGVRRYLEDSGFTEIFSPKLVSSGAEGGANVFTLDYFGREACLAQSPQFYKQTMVPVYGRVFEIAPVFRAEKHDTTRHLNEYVSIDLEMGFIDSFQDIMDTEQAMLTAAFAYLALQYADTLEALRVTLPDTTDIPRIPFTEAKERVAAKYKRKIRDPFDLEPEEERLIGQLVQEEYGSDFVFVTHYPTKKRPFYAMDDPDSPKFTCSFDLLFRGLEITTGGQRIHDFDMQVEKMKAKGLDPRQFESYLMLHKYGCPPHGGLGMGLERMMMQLLGEKNIRATTMFPRDTSRLEP